MSISGMRFRSMAARLKVSCLHSQDLSVERIYPIIEEYLPQSVEGAIKKAYDLDDPNTLWYLLGIDGVVNLEDIHGKFTRVGVSFQEQENSAFSFMKKMRSSRFQEVRKALKIYQYWLFVVDLKHFPTDEEWIDILYSEIDKSATNTRLIVL